MSLRILGIDPGTAIVGFGVVDIDGMRRTHVSHGVIRTSTSDAPAVRLLAIARDLEELVARFTPDEVAVEELFFAKNVTTAMSVAQGRGVILVTVAAAGLEVAEYTPPEVKQAIGGVGNASKREVQEMVRRLLALDALPQPDDAADALAIALTHAVRRSMPRPRA